MQNDNQSTNAIERIALKRQMITRLSEIEARLSTPPLSNLDGMISKIVDAQNHLDSLAGKKLDPRYDAAKAEYEHLVSQRQTWIQERDNFLEQRDRIQSDFDRFDHAISLNEIKEQAAKLLAAESVVSSLDSAIEYQRSIIMTADNVSGSTDLLRQKEDLLADAATGKNVAKKLETIETKISEYEQNCSELTNQARKAEQAIAGLERRRVEAEKVIQAEKADLDEMLVFWFKCNFSRPFPHMMS